MATLAGIFWTGIIILCAIGILILFLLLFAVKIQIEEYGTIQHEEGIDEAELPTPFRAVDFPRLVKPSIPPEAPPRFHEESFIPQFAYNTETGKLVGPGRWDDLTFYYLYGGFGRFLRCGPDCQTKIDDVIAAQEL